MPAVILAAIILLALQTHAIAADPEPDAVTYISRGDAWLDKKEYDKAITNYGEAIRLDPNNPWAYINRVPPGSTRRTTTKPSPITTRPSASMPTIPGLTSTGVPLGPTRRTTTKPSPITTKPSASIQIMPRLTTTAVQLGSTRRTTTKPSPITTRPFASMPIIAWAYVNRGPLGPTRRTTTKPLPITTKPFASIRMLPTWRSNLAEAHLKRGKALLDRNDADNAIADFERSHSP